MRNSAPHSASTRQRAASLRPQRPRCAACADDADTNSAFVARVFQWPRTSNQPRSNQPRSNQRRSNQRRSKPHSYPTAPISGTRRPNFIEHLGTQNRATEPARIQEHSRRRQIILAELCKDFHPKWKLEATSVPIWNTLGSLSRQPTPCSRSGFCPPQWVSNYRPFAPHRPGRIAAGLAAILRLGCLLFSAPDDDLSSCLPVPGERVIAGRNIRGHSARICLPRSNDKTIYRQWEIPVYS